MKLFIFENRLGKKQQSIFLMIFLVFIRLSVHPAYSTSLLLKKSNYQETLTSLYRYILIVYQHEPSLKFKKVKLYSMLNWVRIKPVFYYLILFKLLKSRSFSMLKRAPVKPIKKALSGSMTEWSPMQGMPTVLAKGNSLHPLTDLPVQLVHFK